MPNGFPEGDFRVINEDTSARLFARHGGVTSGQQEARDRLTGEKGTIAYSHTNDPLAMVGTPQGSDIDLWWFSTIKDPWGHPNNYLMTGYKDIRGRFALQDAGYGNGIRFYGEGREGVSKWQAEGGYIFKEGEPGMVLTVVKAGDGSFSLTLADKGAANQKWRFEPKAA